MADNKEIISKIAGNKELLEQVKKADPAQAKELLKKANINVEEEDIKKLQSTIADGNFDVGNLKNIVGGFLK